MGYLLKETLKCLCGVNQWAYAVFWKLGCQNPNLLIWEDCYYETTLDNTQMCVAKIVNEQSEVHDGNKVSVLINRMMTRNPINIVGEGMVGRAAFTGKHQWILSENYLGDDHPQEVLNETRHQFSADMQTVAVIPVLPHGVVQLGSCLVIDENVGFVENVKSLIQQLGCIPDALLSENYTADESAPSIGIPTSLGAYVSSDHSQIIQMTNSTSSLSNSCNQQSILTNSSRLVGESSDSLKRQVPIFPLVTPTFHAHNLPQHLARPHDIPCQSEVIPVIKPSASIKSNVENDFKRSITIPPNLQAWMKLNTNSYSSEFGFNHQNSVGQSGTSCSNIRLKDKHNLSDSNFQNHVSSIDSSSDSFVKPHHRMTRGSNTSAHKNLVGSQLSGRSDSGNSTGSHQKQNSVLKSLSNRAADNSLSHMAGFGLQNFNSFTTDYVPISEMEDSQVRHLKNDSQTLIMEAPPENGLLQALSLPEEHMTLGNVIPEFLHGFPEHNKTENENPRSKNVFLGGFHLQQPSGDDLFDILGVDYRNMLINSNQNSFLDARYIDNQNAGKCSSSGIFQPGHHINSVIGGISEGIVDSSTGSEHLLDAVISKAHLASNQSISDHVSCGETLTKMSGGAPPSTSSTFNGACMSNQMAEGSCSLRSGCLKEDAQNCSQTSSLYGSQISSWVERGNNLNPETSVSTAYSKRPDEISKSNRKRLKPGENPRPRPKDRQMIQDRVKELREIVPNGAKCSIDALLERTIKHMIFLQSVTKHADKLKQTGESQIIRKEGGLLLKDNFEGGATWAFEVGSQSTVCPIIVEDLTPPRQMLVEMLCEERGFFLEIADFIRGLGLTILKGVIEARKGKIWAHFAVEANRDVTRMEIFVSLVGLLEQTSKNSGRSANAISGENMMVHQSFHQAPCIPATSRPHSLQ